MQVHITSPSCLKIDPGFPSLHMLKLPPNPVQTSVLEQTRPGLVKAKGNIVFRTLIPQGEHPSIITNTRFGTRLAADRYLFDFRSEIRGQIYGTYQRGANDNLVTNPLFFGLLLLRERSLAAAGRFGAGELQTEVVRMRIWPGMRVLLETEV